MPYSTVTHYPRSHNPETHPVIGHIRIEAGRWGEFQRIAGDQTQVIVLGHDEAGNDQIDAHVACTTEAVLSRLTNRWSS